MLFFPEIAPLQFIVLSFSNNGQGFPLQPEHA